MSKDYEYLNEALTPERYQLEKLLELLDYLGVFYSRLNPRASIYVPVAVAYLSLGMAIEKLGETISNKARRDRSFYHGEAFDVLQIIEDLGTTK